MAGGPQDLVDCERMLAERGTLRRVYPLHQLTRLEDLLVDRSGELQAHFAFARAASGRCAVTVTVEATARLVCQRCMEAYEFPVAAQTEVEIAADAQVGGSEPPQEVFGAAEGLISLRELAEEELLLALPLVPACSAPAECGKAPALGELTGTAPAAQETVRPFAALQDLLKKHDRK
jgi:uncharacterized protein